MERQLYRPKRNRVIAGVCSGFAEYFAIDPTIIRIVTIIIALSGAGIFAYIIAAIIMPDESRIYQGNDWNSNTSTSTDDFVREHEKTKEDWEQPVKYSSQKNKVVMGGILVILGFVFLIKQFIPGFDWKFLFPLLLIGVGGIIISRGR